MTSPSRREFFDRCKRTGLGLATGVTILRCVRNREAMKLFQREYRKPWVIEDAV